MPPTFEDSQVSRLAEVFRALADPARLRILGALADRPHTGAELSTLLGLTPPTISHHMAKLAESDLISITPDAQRRIYTLNTAALRDLARPTPTSSQGQQTSTMDQIEVERAKTIRDFFVGGRLKQIPAPRRKRVIVLQHLVERFDPTREYPERQVNDALKEAHEDFPTLRRELVNYGFMTRQAGVYRVANALPPRGPTVAQEIPGDERDWLRALLDRALNLDRPENP